MFFHKVGAGQARAETRLSAQIPQQDIDLPRQIPWALRSPWATECAFHVREISEVGLDFDPKAFV